MPIANFLRRLFGALALTVLSALLPGLPATAQTITPPHLKMK